MQKLMISAAAAALVVGLSGAAQAECKIGSTSDYSDADRGVRSGEVRRDLRQLRSAAQILKAHQKEEACEEVVSAIEDIRQNPAGARQSGTPDKDGKTAEAPADRPTWQERNKERFANAKPVGEVSGRFRLDELMDADVVGSDGSTIGEIEDVIMTDAGKPGYVVLGFGGFLGLGEEQAAVPFSQLRVAVDENGDRTYYLPMTAEQLKDAPKFKRGDEKWMDDEEWRKRNDAFYRS